jgi:hypothetical protein
MLIAAFVCGVENGEHKREKVQLIITAPPLAYIFPLTVTELIANH